MCVEVCVCVGGGGGGGGGLAKQATVAQVNETTWSTVKFVNVLSVQVRSRWYLCARKSPYELRPLSPQF